MGLDVGCNVLDFRCYLGNKLTEAGVDVVERPRTIIVNSLTSPFAKPESGKVDFNNATEESLPSRLRDPLQKAGVALSEPQMQQLVKDMLAFRNTPPRSGVISNLDQLSTVNGGNASIINVLKQECYLSSFHRAGVEMVGPKVAGDLRKQAVQAP